ncbi:riboflavin transporter MCH5 [Stachybotrys elegans]|uniref:Riboflavin transporter MCH5 n=1 Tax=Stachybotrys elegans TaxID=80388 RepID=A0A8K0SJ98_9HYPO|nr:riboflavin transporter MCH5 [Stachybotrys elegans]
MSIRSQDRQPDERGNSNNVAVLENMLSVDADEEDYEEGGMAAWLTVLGAWCALLPPMGILNTHAVLQAWVMEHQLQGLPESQVGWIFSCFSFFIYFCGAQVGPIFDAHDIRFLTIPGSIGIVLCLIFTSLSTEYYQFLLAFGVLGGISSSLLFYPALAAIGHWFHKRRAFTTGLACTAGGLGGIVFPTIVLQLAPRIGFGWTLRVIAFISIGLLIVANPTPRKRLPNNKRGGSLFDFASLKELHFGITTIAVWLIEFAVFVPYTYIVSYALQNGFPMERAYVLNALLNAGAVPGRALPGYVADRFGSFNTMCITSLVCAASIWTLWLTAGDDQVRITAFAVLFGFWSGAAISLTPVCISRVCRIEDYGKRNGTAFCVSSIGVLIGVPVAGAIVDASGGDYTGLVVFAGAIYTAAFIAFVVARGVVGGWKFGLV